jgi:hypothetical protein
MREIFMKNLQISVFFFRRIIENENFAKSFSKIKLCKIYFMSFDETFAKTSNYLLLQDPQRNVMFALSVPLPMI